MSRIRESANRLSQWFGIDDNAQHNPSTLASLSDTRQSYDVETAQAEVEPDKDNVVESLFGTNNFYKHTVSV